MEGRCGVREEVWSTSILSILWAGCSFTNGMELKDKKRDRFSNIVSREAGHLEWNEAKVGAGNDYIQRVVQNAVIGRKLYWSTGLKNVKHVRHTGEVTNKSHVAKEDRNNLLPAGDPTKPYTDIGQVHYGQQFQTNREYDREGWPDLVVCMWSGINRLENLRMSNLTGDWSWCVSAWGRMALEKPTYKAKKTSTVYIDQQYEPGEDNYMRGYMMRIRNAHYNLRLTLGNMMAVKYMLKAKGIPQLHYLYSSGQYKPLLFLLDEPVYENTNTWWDSLDIDRKTAVEELPWLESEGMYDMATRLGHPIGERDHPLEDAHAAMAERILGDIKANGLLK